MSVAAIVVAAGRGARFGTRKQFLELNGESMTTRSVRMARSVASRVVVVVPDDYTGDGEGADVVVFGGSTRSASVRAGLAHVGDADVVVVHDAVRPMASASLFERVVDAVQSGADAAVPGLDVVDTIKRIRVDGSGVSVVTTLVRDELMAVQTPQAFLREQLERAHAGGGEASDDAALVEALGARVVVIAGDIDNVKITTPRDVDLLQVRATP